MQRNESNLDRVIRVIIAILAFALAAGIGFTTILEIVLAVIGAVMLLTAALGFCPLYRLAGISTCKRR